MNHVLDFPSRPEMKLHKLFPHNLEFMRLVFLKEGPENAGELDLLGCYGAQRLLERCLHGGRAGNNRDYNTLSVAQRSLVELSKNGKVQVLKPDRRVAFSLWGAEWMFFSLQQRSWWRLHDWVISQTNISSKFWISAIRLWPDSNKFIKISSIHFYKCAVITMSKMFFYSICAKNTWSQWCKFPSHLHF